MLPRAAKALLIHLILWSASPEYSSELKTECVMNITGHPMSVFPCSVRFDRQLNKGVVRDARSGRVYGKDWAEGRGCLYREGYGTICTKNYGWILPDGRVMQ